MTSCLLLLPLMPAVHALESDLEAAGIHVLGAVQRSKLVQEVARLAPDVVVLHDDRVDDELLRIVSALQETSPRPVMLITEDGEATAMQRALEAGVHAYVVKGYTRARLRSLVHLAQARFAHEHRLRERLADVASRFEERKLVERAKGLLMRSRQLSEDEAFKLLRAASMHSNRRVGQVSQQVIASAQRADAINRAGQLRMLSQRLLKLYALCGQKVVGEPLTPSCERVDASLTALERTLSPATFGDLIQAIAVPWSTFKALLAAPPDVASLREADALADGMLHRADRLVAALEESSGAGRLHVINVSGRQRMLSQRVAGQVLLSLQLGGEAARQAAARAQQAQIEFVQAMQYLQSAPLSSVEIRQLLEEAEGQWADLVRAASHTPRVDATQALAESSEVLLRLFEELTERYAHSMQVLMG